MINLIKDSINNITKTYDTNELAFLAMQCKIELQLRDKMAWYMEQNTPTDTYVRREYNPGSRKKCDIAVLNQNYKPYCLIELKAHSAVRYEKEFLDACEKDIKKMNEISPKSQKFYIFFQTEHAGDKIKNNLQGENGMIAYYKIFTIGVKQAEDKGISVEEYIHNQWNEKYSKFGAIEKMKIDAGEYYGIGVTIHVMILQIQ